jgi:ABC-type nitrate/sulfonate/bicarbonate transport system substrate-binding protein
MGATWRARRKLAAALVALAACGAGPVGDDPVVLVLDFLPGGIHSGIYAAAGESYFAGEGLEVEIQTPASAADTLRLVLSGRADVGIAPLPDVARMRADGEDVVVFMALEQVPLGALLSTEAIGITDPSQLENATIGVTGAPSDEAITRVILEESGVDPAGVDLITIGFDAVSNLLSGSVDAAFGFWSSEAVALELEGEKPVVFRPDQYGAPPYPELVLFARGDTVEERGEMLAGFSRAMERGYLLAIDDPDAAVTHLTTSTEGVDAAFARAELDKVAPHLLGPGGGYGEITEEGVAGYLTWAAEVGVLERIPDDLVDSSFLP